VSDDATPARRRRKRRDPCSAHRSDGQPCQASAIPGGTVCPKHGGSAPQVRIKAGRMLRQERVLEAWREVEKQERGSEPWYRAWERLTAAERDLVQYESDLDLLALMKIEIVDPGDPATTAWLLKVARDRMAGRPWTSPLRAQSMNGGG
jgi:hypothetical protein